MSSSESFPSCLTSAFDMSSDQISEVLTDAARMEVDPSVGAGRMNGKILAPVFFEPSTRTRFSFQTAFQRLGGSILNLENPTASAIGKGESLQDFWTMLQLYADVIVVRHPSEGMAEVAAAYCDVPVINAGDGTNEHPTQALTDLYAIHKVGHPSELTIAICGDLRHGRDIHSLLIFLSREPTQIFLVAPPEFQVPRSIQRLIAAGRVRVSYLDHIRDLPSQIDVLYVNRIQRERFANVYGEFDFHLVDDAVLKRISDGGVLLNPLPRSDEIPRKYDSDPRSAFVAQARGGIFVRMALFSIMLT